MALLVNDHKCLDCRHCFRKNETFSVLNHEELEYMNENRMEVEFKQGEIIFKQGSPLTHIVIINKGLGKHYIEGPREKNLILSFALTYEMNGGPGMFVDMRHHNTLVALTDVNACFIDINTVKQTFRKNPDFAEGFIRACSSKTINSYNQFITLTQKNMEGRMAEALLYLKRSVFHDHVIRFVSKQDLADMTAMTRESAIRVIKEFKDEGTILEEDKEITIVNENTLVRYAELG